MKYNADTIKSNTAYVLDLQLSSVRTGKLKYKNNKSRHRVRLANTMWVKLLYIGF